MQRWDLPLGREAFDLALEAAAEALGLSIKRTSLKSLPINVHWHFKRANASGTLEATWLIVSGEAWLSVHQNRRADWIDEAARQICEQFEHC